MAEHDSEYKEISPKVISEGWALKRGTRRKWNKRYFVLRGNVLCYYQNKGDANPKDQFFLSESTCTISDVHIQERKIGGQGEVLYCIKVDRRDAFPEFVSEQQRPKDNDAASPPLATPPSPRLKKTEDRFVSPGYGNITATRSRTSSGDLTPPKQRASLSRYEVITPSTSRDGTPSRREVREIVPASGTPKSKSLPRFSNAGSKRRSQDKTSLRIQKSSQPTQINDELDGLSKNDVVSPAASFEKHGAESEPSQIKESQLMYNTYLATKKAKKKKRQKSIIKGGKIAAAAGATVTVGVLTAGVGVLAGMLFLGIGAAAGGTGVAAERRVKKKGNRAKEVLMAFTDLEEARKWQSALDACLASEFVKESTWGQIFAMEGRSTTTPLVPTVVGIPRTPTADARSPSREDNRKRILLEEAIASEPNIEWRPLDGGWPVWLGTGVHRIRIFREEKCPTSSGFQKPIKGQPCPPLKAQLVLHASPLNAFLCLMSHNRFASSGTFSLPNSGQRASFRVIESFDDNSDVIHLIFRPLYLFPSWTQSRDFVLYRYWRLNDDGSYLVCYDSVAHLSRPPIPGYVRGQLHGVYTIAPRKSAAKKVGASRNLMNDRDECLLTAVVQVDPCGWVPHFPLPPLSNQGYGEAFAVAALLQMLDMQDALDNERFVPTQMDLPSSQPLASPRKVDEMNGTTSLDPSSSTDSIEPRASFSYDLAYAMAEDTTSLDSMKGFTSQPACLPSELWAQPDANSFLVRGKHYMTDRKKQNAGSPIGRLVAVDAVRVAKNFFTGFCAHPKERMQLALERERRLKEEGFPSDLPPFFFVVNICIPGFHMVFYFAVDDMSTIDGTDGTPESKLSHEFFFGSSDKMREETFKLIPRIVVGNFVVKKTVGSTPAIMGKKLRQLYVKGERFFEVVLDCGSSAVAAGSVRLCLGYAETLVVDMGFLLEGKDDSRLPEKIFGCVRMKHVPFDNKMRFVEQPPTK